MILRVVSVGLNAACDDSQLERICTILLGYTGHDFSGYKGSTLARRIEKRVQARHVSRDEYVELLSNDPSEAEALLADV
jgi:two-component system CheB/CheR fusion protein